MIHRTSIDKTFFPPKQKKKKNTPGDGSPPMNKSTSASRSPELGVERLPPAGSGSHVRATVGRSLAESWTIVCSGSEFRRRFSRIGFERDDLVAGGN